MITRLRQLVARWLALAITIVTLGRVEVNATGRQVATDSVWTNDAAQTRPVPPDPESPPDL